MCVVLVQHVQRPADPRPPTRLAKPLPTPLGRDLLKCILQPDSSAKALVFKKQRRLLYHDNLIEQEYIAAESSVDTVFERKRVRRVGLGPSHQLSSAAQHRTATSSSSCRCRRSLASCSPSSQQVHHSPTADAEAGQSHIFDPRHAARTEASKPRDIIRSFTSV